MWGYCRQNRRCPEDYSIEESKIKDYLSYTFDTDSRSLSLHTNIITEIIYFLLSVHCYLMFYILRSNCKEWPWMVKGFRSTPTCWFNVSMYQFQNMWMVKWTHKINTSIAEIQFPKKKGDKVYEKCCMRQKKKGPSLLCRKRNQRSSGSNAPSTYRKWHGMKNLKCLTYWSYAPYYLFLSKYCLHLDY